MKKHMNEELVKIAIVTLVEESDDFKKHKFELVDIRKVGESYYELEIKENESEETLKIEEVRVDVRNGVLKVMMYDVEDNEIMSFEIIVY